MLSLAHLLICACAFSGVSSMEGVQRDLSPEWLNDIMAQKGSCIFKANSAESFAAKVLETVVTSISLALNKQKNNIIFSFDIAAIACLRGHIIHVKSNVNDVLFIS